ncbi:MAG: VWA domain-containing protein [Candidatus Eisenbacteria bacterium]|uniref:VWA domain-containing protein n=1 Tax=Eiseniibacteriota bacterium TaxID=2212470 RepID=A0A937X9D2_UNCEI|nr:VWA domain-containing protein [Candidatus Eisenbacteria bacterium]
MNRSMRMACLSLVFVALALPEAMADQNSGIGNPEAWAPYAPGTILAFGEPRVASRDSCECLDLVLVIDDTGSMGGAISNVQAGLLDILDLATSTCGDVRAGLVTFKDDVEVDVPLTANLNLVINAVNALYADGGANEPEASDEALREVFTSTVCPLTGDFDPSAWRDGCCKVTILVTDANPGGCDDMFIQGIDDVNAHNRALDAAAMGIQIGAVFVPTWGDPYNTITPIMLDYAATTNGVFGQTAWDGSGTADAIEQVILNCIGASATELCCLPDGQCVRLLEGDCERLSGTVVDDCDECLATPADVETWGQIKARFRDAR